MENSFDFITPVVYKLAIGKLITARGRHGCCHCECIKCGTDGGIIIIIEFTARRETDRAEEHAPACMIPR